MMAGQENIYEEKRTEFQTSSKDCLFCSSCGNINPKYCCPRCEIKSCSLNCVKNHKLKDGCSGQRNKTKFVAKSEYNEKTFVEDYRFLEEANRVADNAFRDKKNKINYLSGNAKKLRNKARQRGIHLKLMPVGFKRRTENTTFYHHRFNLIRWRVNWIFPQASTEYVENRVSEKEIIRELIKKYINPIHADPVYKQKLKVYHAVDPGEIGVFLEDLCTHENKFVKIDTSKTLEEALNGKVIVEYPSFHVVLPHHVMEFPVANSSSGAKRQRLNPDLSTTYENTKDGAPDDIKFFSGGFRSLENKETEQKTKATEVEKVSEIRAKSLDLEIETEKTLVGSITGQEKSKNQKDCFN